MHVAQSRCVNANYQRFKKKKSLFLYFLRTVFRHQNGTRSNEKQNTSIDRYQMFQLTRQFFSSGNNSLENNAFLSYKNFLVAFLTENSSTFA